MSRLHGWKPKPKFTCGLNVSQAQWDKIFGKKSENEELPSASLVYPWFLPKDHPCYSPRPKHLTNPEEQSKKNS
jgi:hypothetical protein